MFVHGNLNSKFYVRTREFEFKVLFAGENLKSKFYARRRGLEFKALCS